jgi:hypothetical protein
VQDPEPAARASLRRSLLIYTALLASDLLFLAFLAPNIASGFGYVSLSVVGIVGLLLAYQVYQHYRDTQAQLAETDGIVQRKWKRADLIVAMQSFYITVDRVVFRVTPEDFVSVDEGMFVKVVHFPNTLHVVSVHEMRRPEPPPAPPLP